MKKAMEMYDEGWCDDCNCDAATCLQNGVCFASVKPEDSKEVNDGKEPV